MEVLVNGKQIAFIIYCIIAVVIVAVSITTMSWSGLAPLLIIMFSLLAFAVFLFPLLIVVIIWDELATKKRNGDKTLGNHKGEAKKEVV